VFFFFLSRRFMIPLIDESEFVEERMSYYYCLLMTPFEMTRYV